MSIFSPPPRQFTPADLNLDHPLAAGLVFLCFPGQGSVVDFVSRRPPSNIGNRVVIATQYGMVGAPASADWTGAALAPIQSGVTAFTVATIAAPVNSANLSRPYLQYDGGTSDTRLSFNANFLDTPTAGVFALNSYVFGGGHGVDSNAGAVDGGWHVFAGSSYDDNVTLAELFLDGVAGHNTSTSIPARNENAPMQIGGLSEAPYLLTCAWARALSNAEHLSFAQNPWQIFRAAQPYWVPKFAPVGVGFPPALFAQPINTLLRM